MVEYIGAAAALTQLVKYSFEIGNSIPNFTRRIRQAPLLVRQWNDHATLLLSLAQTMQQNSILVNQSTRDILDRCISEANELHSLLARLVVVAEDGRFAKVKKKLTIIRKEREVEKVIMSIVERSDIIHKHFVILDSIRVGVDTRSISSIAQLSGSTQISSETIGSSSYSLKNFFYRGEFCRNPHYIGQSALLQSLLNWGSNTSPSALAISGLGGSGKSQVVIEFAHQLHETSTDMTILLLDGSSRDGLENSLIGFAKEAGNSRYIQPTIGAVCSWLDLTDCGTWVMILDNCDFETFANTNEARSLLSTSSQGKVLFTTRNRQFALQFVHPYQLIDMPLMTVSDAQSLLLSSSCLLETTTEDVVALVSALDYSPFAIVRAGYYIKIHSSTIKQYLEALKRCHTAAEFVIEECNNLFQELHTENFSSILCSSTLWRRHTDTTPLMRVLACFDQSRIPYLFLGLIPDCGRTKLALSVLKAYYVLKSDSPQGTIELNPFARAVIRMELKKDPKRSRIMECALQTITKSIPSTDTAFSVGQSHAFAAHLESVISTLITLVPGYEVAQTTHSLLGCTVLWLSQYHLLFGNSQNAKNLIDDVEKWIESAFDPDLSIINALRSQSAVIDLSLCRYQIAADLTLSVLRSRVRALGDYHVDTLRSLNNLGLIYESQGLHQKAERYHRKALDIKEELFGRRDIDTLVSVNNLALSLQSQNQHAQAEQLFRRALICRKRLLAPDHIDLFVSMNNLGVSLQLQGRLSESKSLHQAALAGTSHVFGYLHHQTLKSKANLALVLHSEGHFAQAIGMMRDVSKTYKNTIGPSHTDTIRALRNVAIFLQRQSDFQEAEAIMYEVLAAQEDEFGKEDVRTLNTLQYISTLLHFQEKFAEAFDLAMWLLEIRQEKLGLDHPDTACSLEHVKELEGLLGMGNTAQFDARAVAALC